MESAFFVFVACLPMYFCVVGRTTGAIDCDLGITDIALKHIEVHVLTDLGFIYCVYYFLLRCKTQTAPRSNR